MKVLAFGIARDILGDSQITVSSSDLKTVVDLRSYLDRTYPQFSALNSLAIAVNEEYAEGNVELNDDDVVALIPPVSGG